MNKVDRPIEDVLGPEKTLPGIDDVVSDKYLSSNGSWSTLLLDSTVFIAITIIPFMFVARDKPAACAKTSTEASQHCYLAAESEDKIVPSASVRNESDL
ncbi:hypothetical protein KIN20_002738 [Parelaphostrongylus tenuis]|uniref:Uncharacterized protein n=1 Tax=Parelaphostrongylus tenuis TaxID=148309 RepID=A0AAD5LY62_PARTN|nr:hypothetical protein KIN20_002738 [Parelaphostrongylus tenuis]